MSLLLLALLLACAPVRSHGEGPLGALSPDDGALSSLDNPYSGSDLAFADSDQLTSAAATGGEAQRALLLSNCLCESDRQGHAEFCSSQQDQVSSLLAAASPPAAPFELPDRAVERGVPPVKGHETVAALTPDQRRADEVAALRRAGAEVPDGPLSPGRAEESVALLQTGAGDQNPVSPLRWGKTIKYAFWQLRSVGLLMGEQVNFSFRQAAARFTTDPKGPDAVWPYFDDTRQITPSVFHKFDPVNDEVVAKFRAAVRYIEQLTCLRFEEVPADEDADKIMVARSQSILENASVGRGKNARFRLPHGSKSGFHLIKLSDASLFGVGVVVHEILHALGIGHTMMRKDASRFLEVDLKVLGGLANQFVRQPDDVDPDLLAFDYGSLMSYSVFSGHTRRMRALMPKSQPGEDPVKGPSAVRRALNEDDKSGGLGHALETFGTQGQLSTVDTEGVNRAYGCTGHMRARPPSKELHPHLAGAASVCACPVAQYRARAAAGQDCVPGDKVFVGAVAKAVYELPAAGVKKGSPLAALTRAGGAADEAKSVAAIARALNPRSKKTAAFLASCRLYCEVQPEYAEAGCWVNARKFPRPLKITAADKKKPLPWSFRCNHFNAVVPAFGCFFHP